MLKKGSFKLPPGTGGWSERELVCFLLHRKGWMQTRLYLNMCQELNETDDQVKARSEKPDMKHEF